MKKYMFLGLVLSAIGFVDVRPSFLAPLYYDEYRNMQCNQDNYECNKVVYGTKKPVNHKDVKAIAKDIEKRTGQKLSQAHLNKLAEIVTHPRPKNSKVRNQEMMPNCNSVMDCECGCSLGCGSNQTCVEVCRTCTAGEGADPR